MSPAIRDNDKERSSGAEALLCLCVLLARLRAVPLLQGSVVVVSPPMEKFGGRVLACMIRLMRNFPTGDDSKRTDVVGWEDNQRLY